jgi:hypothetical protein
MLEEKVVQSPHGGGTIKYINPLSSKYKSELEPMLESNAAPLQSGFVKSKQNK